MFSKSSVSYVFVFGKSLTYTKKVICLSAHVDAFWRHTVFYFFSAKSLNTVIYVFSKSSVADLLKVIKGVNERILILRSNYAKYIQRHADLRNSPSIFFLVLWPCLKVKVETITQVLTPSDFVQNDGSHFRRLSSFLHLALCMATPSPFFGLF